MNVETVPISTLTLDPANARAHPEGNLAAIRGSLQRFGQQKPIVVDGNNVVRAGNGTLQAIKQLGWDTVRIVRTDLKGSEATAYAIADNRTGELAEWDDGALARTLESLKDEGMDLEQIGFTQQEVDDLIVGLGGEPNPKEIVEDDPPLDRADELLAKWQVKVGQVWEIPSKSTPGKSHRLLCGDSTKAEDVAKAMSGQKADLCFTSPPYGQQRDYTGDIGDWDTLMQGVFGNLPMADAGQVLVNLGLIHREGEWQPYWEGWIEWMRAQGWRRFGWYVWDQGPGLPGDWNGRLAPSHEFVFHFNRVAEQARKTKESKWAGEVNHGTGLREKSGVTREYTHIGMPVQDKKIPDSVIRVMRHKARGIEVSHPAVFPVSLVAEVATAFSDSADTAYEPFLGSGTTMVAAEQTGRLCCGIEIAPKYCAVILERMVNLGLEPHAVS